MFSDKGLGYYGLRKGDQDDFKEQCSICNEQMEAPVIADCGHKYDFGCVTVRIHDRCPCSICGYNLSAETKSNSMPTTQHLVENHLRMGRMTDFKVTCPICKESCTDPVYTNCGHIVDFMCIVENLNKGAGLCPGTREKKCGKDLTKYIHQSSGPVRFAQYDQDQASYRFAFEQCQAQARYMSQQVLQLQKASDDQERRLAEHQREIRHMQRRNREIEYQSACREAEVLYQQTEQARDRHSSRQKELEVREAEVKRYGNLGYDALYNDRKSFATANDAIIYVDARHLFQSIHRAAEQDPYYHDLKKNHPGGFAALQSAWRFWQTKINRRNGHTMYCEDLIQLLGVSTVDILVHEGWVTASSDLPRAFGDFLKKAIRNGSKPFRC